ncbi:hypothetical protein KP78_03100 [Jeotgalibacillus soli]|uniref:Uncharacterized protein n=1 Tax=Jeotgalibacillus soli TaxID=889306 RepID=A0A0C2RNU3_9BACL|nr:hypothetical protein KP78_03100 [Jeotgalibacillus soli]
MGAVGVSGSGVAIDVEVAKVAVQVFSSMHQRQASPRALYYPYNS